jgi:hypothetical protein
MSIHRERLGASRPAAGGAAHAFGRERRWPSFIIWRWAGPAQGGWTHYPRKAPLLPPPRRHHPLISMSHQPAGVRKRGPARGPGPGGSRPLVPPREAPRSRPVRAPRRALAGPPSGRARRLSGVAVPRLARVPGSLPGPAVASRRHARVAAVPPPASGPRKDGAAGGASPGAPGPRRS